MMPLVLLCLLIGIPVLIAIVFRVNAVFVFLGIAVGDLLVRYLSDDAVLAASAFTRSDSMPMVVRLFMLLVPLVLVLLVLKKSMPRTGVLMQLFPLGVIGLAVASLAIPLFPDNVQSEIFSLSAGGVLRRAQDIIIAIAAVLALLVAFQSFKHRDGKKGKKHH